MLLIVGSLVVGGRGDDEDTPAAPQQGDAGTATSPPVEQDGAQTTTLRGTRITTGESAFGTMLFDAKKQAVYSFEKDRKATGTARRPDRRSTPTAIRSRRAVPGGRCWER